MIHLPNLKLCPYCGNKHRKQSKFLKCERKHRPVKWKKSPKV